MKRIVLWLMSTLSAVVWLFNYRTSTAGPLATAAGPSSSGGQGPVDGTAQGPSPSNGPITRVAGAAVNTRWGPVQVQLEIQKGKIVGVDLLQQPSDNAMDTFIGNRSVPVLIKETIAAQSAKIDMVTGATFTSTGYLKSLQSALDKAAL
jgi:hypothetical protein